jgi:hypothetical protein
MILYVTLWKTDTPKKTHNAMNQKDYNYRDNKVHNEDESIKYGRNVARQGGCSYMKTLSGTVNDEIEPLGEGHTIKLILDSLGQVRVIDETVNWFFLSENHVEIGYILSYTKLGDAKKIKLNVQYHTTGLATLGLNGGWIFFSFSSLKSIWL